MSNKEELAADPLREEKIWNEENSILAERIELALEQNMTPKQIAAYLQSFPPSALPVGEEKGNYGEYKALIANLVAEIEDRDLKIERITKHNAILSASQPKGKSLEYIEQEAHRIVNRILDRDKSYLPNVIHPLLEGDIICILKEELYAASQRSCSEIPDN